MIATERVMIHEADLPNLRRVGAKLRAGCPLHGSDHQRSLSIEPEGDYAGFGKCFGCGAQVLIEEMNPDAARRLKAHGAGTITAEKLLRPVRRFQAEQSDWQKEELEALLALDAKMRSALLQSERARAYLAARCISYDLASALGVGYLPPAWKDRPEVAPLQKWLDRLVFPLCSPDGRGSIGRALAGWHPGMDENEHKRVLDEPGAPERWRKTYPAGWFGLADGEQIIIVEGAFDRLALVEASLPATSVVALAGSRDSRAAEWLPAHIQRVIIALDGDKSGKEAAEALRQRLYLAGIDATICAPPDDSIGKDWSERLRLGGLAALSPLLDAARAPAESAEPLELRWDDAWNQLTYRERIFAMAERQGYPAMEIGDEHIPAGDWRAWRRFADQGKLALAAEAYDRLLPRFTR